MITEKITNYWHLNFLLLIAPKRGWHLCSINTGPYGENTEIYFFSEAIALIEPKLCINHWKVLYKLCVFYVDRNSKMTTTAGHSFYIGPIDSFYNQVNDTGSWEPLVLQMCHGIYFIKEKNPSLQKFLTIINAYTWQKVDIIEIPLQDHLANLKCISNGPSLHVQDKNIKIIKSSNLTILF